MSIIFYINGERQYLPGEEPIKKDAAAEVIVAEQVEEPAGDEDAEEQDEKSALKAKLTDAGISLDGRAGIAKLRELAASIPEA